MSEHDTAPASLSDAPSAAAGVRTAGQMLRELREAAGVDPALLASAMKVSLPKLEALENDRIELLPDVTFARGLAAAVCRAFGVDPAPVLERMPLPAAGLRPAAPAINQPFRRSGDRPASVLGALWSRPLLMAVAVLLLGAAALWLLPTLPIQLGAPPPAGEMPATEGVLRENVPVPAAEPALVPQPPASAAAPTAPTPLPEPLTSPAASGSLLQFTAQGESWITVRDATGKALINRALAAGETAHISGGELPLSVTVGRKDEVEVRVRGEPFDHRALSKTTVSRFEVK